MIKILEATIVKNGKPFMSFEVDKEIKADRLEAYRRSIKSRYIRHVKPATDEVQVDLRYKIMVWHGDKKQNPED